MRAGSLRDKITLMSPVPNDWGEHDGWQEVATLNAAVKDTAGDLTETAGADTHKRTIVATIRYRKHLRGNEQVVWMGKSYVIAHIELDPKRRFLLLTCEREQ